MNAAFDLPRSAGQKKNSLVNLYIYTTRYRNEKFLTLIKKDQKVQRKVQRMWPVSKKYKNNK